MLSLLRSDAHSLAFELRGRRLVELARIDFLSTAAARQLGLALLGFHWFLNPPQVRRVPPVALPICCSATALLPNSHGGGGNGSKGKTQRRVRRVMAVPADALAQRAGRAEGPGGWGGAVGSRR